MKKKPEKDFSERNLKNVIHLKIPLNVNSVSGLASGFLISIFLHPFDRAFYLKSIDLFPKKLFSPEYWGQDCFSGLRTTIYQRIVTNSVYYTAQGELHSRLKPWMLQHHYSAFSTHLSIGLLAGMANSVFSNWIYTIKYYSFTQDPAKKPLENAKEMWRKGGFYPFTKGWIPSGCRDMLFGVTYEVCNWAQDTAYLNNLNQSIESEPLRRFTFFASRSLSAAPAILASTVPNFIRNRQCASAPDQPQPSAAKILNEIWQQSNQHVKTCPSYKMLARTLFFFRLFMVGAGTARAALQIGLTQTLVEHLKEILRYLDMDEEPVRMLENR